MYSVSDPNNRSARESDGAIDVVDHSYDSRGRLERGRVWGLGGIPLKRFLSVFLTFQRVYVRSLITIDDFVFPGMLNVLHLVVCG